MRHKSIPLVKQDHVIYSTGTYQDQTVKICDYNLKINRGNPHSTKPKKFLYAKFLEIEDWSGPFQENITKKFEKNEKHDIPLPVMYIQ